MSGPGAAGFHSCVKLADIDAEGKTNEAQAAAISQPSREKRFPPSNGTWVQTGGSFPRHLVPGDYFEDSDGKDDEGDLESSMATEARHFQDVCEAFASYAFESMGEVSRMETYLQGLSDDDKLLLMEDVPSRIKKIKEAVLMNQKFLELILIDQKVWNRDDQTDEYHDCISQSALSTPARPVQPSSPSSLSVHTCNDHSNRDPVVRSRSSSAARVRNASKVRGTLRQFVRDWSAEGEEERRAAYDPLLQDLEKFIPLDAFRKKHGRSARVLCPGSGLGRLPFEVVKRGYGCQGNEFSYFMLLGSNLILNSNMPKFSCCIQPYCLSSSNRLKHDQHLHKIYLPDTVPGDYVREDHEFSMCAGEFVEVYWPQEKEWDVVLTSFFVDTAKNILLYIRTIARILTPGGMWANLGPLLYHFAEMRNEISIELSWEEIRNVIIQYFEIVLEEDSRDAYYTTDSRSMMQVQYHCIHFVAIRNDKAMLGSSKAVY